MAKNDKLINLGLKTILVTDYAIASPVETPPNGHVFTFDFFIQHNASFEQKAVVAIVTVKIFESEEKQQLFCSLTTNFVFNISNLEDFTIETNGNKNLTKECLLIINSISVSSVRGILYEKNKGTFLQDIYLPIIDPTKFAQEEVNP